MSTKWTQLHPRQWPTIIHLIDREKGKFEFVAEDYTECWIHRIGYYLIRIKYNSFEVTKKRWLLISPANGELLGDWTFNSTKKKPPLTEANKILSERLLGMRMS